MLLNKKKCNILFDKNMKSAKRIINEWFKRGGIKLKKLDLILSKIDFNHEGNVFISKNERCYDSFCYSLDGEKISGYEDILLLNPRRICVRSYGKEELYEYVEDPLASDGFRLIKIKSRISSCVGDNSNVCNFLLESSFSSNSLLFYNNNVSINLNIIYSSKSKLLREEAKEFNNFLELKNYLKSLTFPCSILDVYKIICELSLGDISQYHSVSLSISKKIGENKKIETDRILLRNGKLYEFKMTTSDGKVIDMNQFGNFSYTLEDESISFSMKELEHDQISYSVSSNTDKMIDDYMDGLMTYDIGIARRELSATKKRVREMFPKSKR